MTNLSICVVVIVFIVSCLIALRWLQTALSRIEQSYIKSENPVEKCEVKLSVLPITPAEVAEGEQNCLESIEADIRRVNQLLLNQSHLSYAALYPFDIAKHSKIRECLINCYEKSGWNVVLNESNKMYYFSPKKDDQNEPNQD